MVAIPSGTVGQMIDSRNGRAAAAYLVLVPLLCFCQSCPCFGSANALVVVEGLAFHVIEIPGTSTSN